MEKHQISMDLSRINGKTVFKFAIPDAIEKLWKEKSNGVITESQSWEGNKFYSIQSILKNREYQDVLYKYYCFDNYGSSIFNENGYFNIAWLRTVGGNGEITISDEISFRKATESVRNATEAIKAYLELFEKPYTVTSKLTVEL